MRSLQNPESNAVGQNGTHACPAATRFNRGCDASDLDQWECRRPLSRCAGNTSKARIPAATNTMKYDLAPERALSPPRDSARAEGRPAASRRTTSSRTVQREKHQDGI